MTPSGEQLTLKGESKSSLENLFSFNRAMPVSYSMEINYRGQIEIKTSYPDKKPLETFQMIFVLNGKIRFDKQDDRSGFGEIGTLQHNLCRTAPRFSHRIMCNLNDEIICINLNYAFLSRYLPNSHPAYLQLTSSRGEDNPVMLFPVNMQITPEISAILQRIGNFSTSDFCDQLLLESKVIELLALQISQFEALQNTALPSLLKNEELEKMQEAREILISNAGKGLSLRSLAHLVGTNEFYLKRNFKTAFGNTVFGYLNQYRMEKAKDMLVEQDITIGEISKKIGYKHATHFTSAFKKYFGYLPNRIKSGRLSFLIFFDDLSVIFENINIFTG